MRNIIPKAVLAVGLVLVVTLGVNAQQLPNEWTDFFDSLSTFNGQPMPVGSVVDAFAPDGAHCGTWTVHTAGLYGFMPVYGDDQGLVPPYDGATLGEAISFTINDRPATIVFGDNTWDPASEPKNVRLAAIGTSVIFGIEMPGDTVIAPGESVTLTVRVRNDSPDGLKDLYSVNAVNSHSDFNAVLPDTFVYAAQGEVVSVVFNIEVPAFVSNPDDTVNTATFSVYSELDPAQTVDGTVKIYMSVTDAPDDIFALLPQGFRLEQNYPNPFNPVTNIAFTLPGKTTVRLEVIDILGRFVDVRNLGLLPAGEHQIEYDASSFASGVYFYRVVTDKASQSRKMILLK